MTAGPAAHGQGRRQGVAPPAGPANSLLVVEPGWGHVREQDGSERADVHASLHCRGDGQDIDAVHLGLLAVEEHLLELCLPGDGVEQVGLPCEFLRVESEGLPAPQGKP